MTGSDNISVTLLAGGVGGAKMAEGLAHLDGVDLTVIGNIADDEEFHGLWVSPDIDTMIYTLSDRINRDQGWGVADEALRALSVLKELGQDTWMTLGDRDLGLHIYRTMRLRQGIGRQAITDEICRAFHVPARLVLATEDVVQTRVRTSSGWCSFQEYFVRGQCRPDVLELSYEGQAQAVANPAAIAAIATADVIVLAPSNPLMSIQPILGIGGIADAVHAAKAPRIAVSPLIGGKALKGPADRMLKSLGFEPSNESIAAHYLGLIDLLVIDNSDAVDLASAMASGPRLATDDIIMKTREEKIRLAQHLLQLAWTLTEDEVTA